LLVFSINCQLTAINYELSSCPLAAINYELSSCQLAAINYQLSHQIGGAFDVDAGAEGPGASGGFDTGGGEVDHVVKAGKVEGVDGGGVGKVEGLEAVASPALQLPAGAEVGADDVVALFQKMRGEFRSHESTDTGN
jgi:hypothetical protein